MCMRMGDRSFASETTGTRRAPVTERSEKGGQTPAEAVSVSDDGTVRPESVPLF